MSNLKRSLFWVTFYVAIIFLLGQLDFIGRPVINLASYFYILAFVIVPCVVLIPFVYRVPYFIAMIFWAIVYFVLNGVLDRSLSAPSNVENVLIEVILLELGVWISYRLAVDLANSESLVNIMAQSTFPNQAIDINSATHLIKTEFNRSRRYNRSLSLLAFYILPQDQELYEELFKSNRQDLLSRFSLARMGQVIDECIRQTDTLIRDEGGHFIVLCPETDANSATMLGIRIHEALMEKTGRNVSWGMSTFPDKSLTFDELLDNALKSAYSANDIDLIG